MNEKGRTCIALVACREEGYQNELDHMLLQSCFFYFLRWRISNIYKTRENNAMKLQV